MSKVYAIIGPPASGKSSILRELLKFGDIGVLVSHTTRAPQPGEQDGENYHFVDKPVFCQLHMVEKVTYSGHLYGLCKDEVMSKVNQNPVTVVDIDVAGFEQLKKLLGDRIVSIYILVDKDTALTRYIAQAKASDDIKKRLEYAESQMEFDIWPGADHVVKNTGTLDLAVRQVLAIMDLVVPKAASQEA